MASVLDLVKHYQRSIEKYPNDEQKILKCIDKLYNLGVTVQHLQDTGVGRTVNALRKEPGEVGQAARALVLKWKVMVAAEESDQEGDHNDDTTNYSSHDNGRDYESNSSKSRSKHETSERSDRTPKTEEKYHKHTNGNYSGSKRKYQSSEEEELDTKKSKYSRDNGYTIKTGSKIEVEPDKTRSDSEDSQDESSQSDSNSEDSQSEEESVPEVKPKIEKKHQIEPHKSSSHSKHSSSSRDKHKQETSHPKQHTEKQEHNDSRSDKRHSSDKTKDKSHSSHSHKSSREHEKSTEKKDKEHRHSEKEKVNKEESSSKHSDRHRSNNSSDKFKTSTTSEKHKSVSSSDKHKFSGNSEKHKSSSSEHKHKSSSSSEKNKSNSSEHHGSSSEKNLHNNAEKQSSHKSDKERHKRSYENEVANDKYKSVERSSKDEQIKEKSKEKHNSSKDKDSHKTEKKHSSKDTESSKSKQKCDSSHSASESTKKSKHKSSSNKHKSKSSEEKEKPKKGEDSDDGIDCGSGASFAEALGMFVSPTKPKKKSGLSKENMQSPNSPNYDLSAANLLAPNTKLAPLPPALEILSLPEISPHYRPRAPPKFLPHFNDEEAMSSAISSKNQRTKVYSGNKVIGKITSLYDMCVQVLQEHIEALEYTGGVPYEILKPVVDKATPQQLFVLEHYNPYLMDDTDHLWQKFCEKSFRNKKRQEMETWREMYIRCQEEQEIKLRSLTANIKMTQEAKKAPIKQTKMAYVDSVVKPPRNIAKKQAQHGTAFAATASPAARVASLSATSNVLKGGRAAPAPVLTSNFKPKKAPLMQKALQFMRGRKR